MRRFHSYSAMIYRAVVLSCIAGIVLLFSTPAGAAAAGSFTKVEGAVDMLRSGAMPAVAVKAGDPVSAGDVVRTKSNSSAEITFSDGNVLKLAQRTRIDISEYIADTKGVIKLPRGKVEATVPPKNAQRIAVSPTANKFEIHTPNAVAGVRGTKFVGWHLGNVSGFLLENGLLLVINQKYPDQPVNLAPGQITRVGENTPPDPARAATGPESEAVRADFAEGRGSRTRAGGVDELLAGRAGAGDFGAAGTAGGSALSAFSDIPGLGEFIASPPAPHDPTLPPPFGSSQAPTPPPFAEVGRTTLSGSVLMGPSGQFDFISVVMNDVVFLAPSTGAKPTIWQTNAISGDYSFGQYLKNGVTTIPISDGQGLNGNFAISQWSASGWAASVAGSGNISGGSFSGPINFSGNANGTHTGGNSGSFSGSGSGTVK